MVKLWEKKKVFRGSAAFSLVELLIVLAIVLIMAALAVGFLPNSRRRSVVQSEAIAIAYRIEQAKGLAQTLRQGNRPTTEYRILFNTTAKTYTPEVYENDNTINNVVDRWKPAPAISSTAFRLNPKISFDYPTGANRPDYGPTITTIANSLGTGVKTVPEIRFNSRGFPVEWTTATAPPPTLPREAGNEVYLTDGREFFAITVNVLGRVEVWAYTTVPASTWVKISG